MPLVIDSSSFISPFHQPTSSLHRHPPAAASSASSSTSAFPRSHPHSCLLHLYLYLGWVLACSHLIIVAPCIQDPCLRHCHSCSHLRFAFYLFAPSHHASFSPTSPLTFIIHHRHVPSSCTIPSFYHLYDHFLEADFTCTISMYVALGQSFPLKCLFDFLT
jgi:hypothetical protein